MPVALPPGRAPTDDLATPLAEVTFVVVDLETTGGAPAADGITEVGALKFRGGERLGTFHTLVNPGVALPPFVAGLTGITEAMLVPAPTIAEVLPALAEFVGGAVVVGHNVGYDIAFLDAAFAAHHYPGLRAHRRVDTLALARRLVRDEVEDLRLATLAHHLRVATTPTHRAFADAAATAEVLHALLERAGTLGVLGLDDLLELPAIRPHPTAHKLKLTARLPRAPGVYLFRDCHGRVLYVGRAERNLRGRIRRHFAADGRRTVPQMIRLAKSIEHIVCADPLEAVVRQLRLIREHEPRFNPQPKAWRRRAYVELQVNGKRPRLAVVRRAGGANWLGPLPTTAAARLVRNALAAAVAPPELGDVMRRGVGPEPELLPRLLERHLADLVAEERFEEAAAIRDGIAALRVALAHRRRLDAARRQGPVVVDGRAIALDGTDEVDEQLALARGLERGALPRAAAGAGGTARP